MPRPVPPVDPASGLPVQPAPASAPSAALDPEAEVPGSVASEPSLREHLATRWRTWPVLVLGALLAAFVGFGVWTLGGHVVEAVEGPSEEDLAQRAALARAEWAAMRRQAPVALGAEPVAEDLGPGDAERTDDRYADYYLHEADSTAFSVLVTATDFSPDLFVRLPDGQTVAASNLLRTSRRAEISGLTGPGRFEVVVTSLRPGAAGTYQVEVVPAGPVDSVYVDEEARLDTLGGAGARSGRFERVYGVSTGVETPVVLRVVSPAFAPRLHLFGPNGELDEKDRTLEQSAQGDSLFGVVLRYMPGWEAPYRLVVTSETPGATGPFAVDVQSVPVHDLRLDGKGVRGTLGDESWLAEGRYVDTYRFRAPADRPVTITVRSDEVPPAVRLWRIERSARADVVENLNAAGAASVTLERALEGGDYRLEVLSGGEVKAGAPAQGGVYSVVADVEEPEPAAPDSTRPWEFGPAPGRRVFATEVRRTGRSGGSTFEVGVTTVAISYPGDTRTRVQLSVTVRSVDYTGNWAPWASFAGKAYLVDDTGRRYQPAIGESQSPSGDRAEPGTARRGTVVFYAPSVARGVKRLVLVASVGEENVTLPIPIP